MKDFIFTLVIIITLLLAISLIFSGIDNNSSNNLKDVICKVKEDFLKDDLQNLYKTKLLDQSFYDTASMTSKQYYDSIWHTPILPIN